MPVRKRRLKSLNDVVRATAWLFNAVASGEIEPALGGRLCYILNSQRATLATIEELEIKKKEISEFEERLKKVETAIENQTK